MRRKNRQSVRGLTPNTALIQLQLQVPQEVSGLVAGHLLKNDSAKGLLSALKVAHYSADEVVRILVQRHDNPQWRMACAKGCSLCCTARVHVSVSEALLIAVYLRETRSIDELAAISEAVSQMAEKLMSTPFEEWDYISCPLLTGHECSVYEVRPFVCRRANSVDMSVCRTYFLDRKQVETPMNGIHYTLYQAFMTGWEAATEIAGQNDMVCDFIPALNIALQNPNAAERWFNGDPLFEKARATPLALKN